VERSGGALALGLADWVSSFIIPFACSCHVEASDAFMTLTEL